VFVNNQHGIQRQRQDFDNKFLFEWVDSKKIDRRILKVGMKVGNLLAFSSIFAEYMQKLNL